MDKGPNSTEKRTAASFQEIQDDYALQWEVSTVNWQHVRVILDIEAEQRGIKKSLRRLVLYLGKMVIKGEEPDPMIVIKAQGLKEKLGILRSKCEQTRDQMRAAMRQQLEEMLPPGVLDEVTEDVLEEFFADMEKTTSMPLRFSRLLADGLKKAEREPGSD